jgi:hypothetical protein
MRKTLRFSLMLIAFILPLLSYIEKPSDASAGRFIDNGDGTVTDTRRKLMWQKGDNGNEVTFEQAQEYCRNLSLGGHADWRLPRPDERDTAVAVELMMPTRSRAAYARLDLYWSSDPTVLIPFNYHPSLGAEVSRAYPAKHGDRAFVRAVRSLTVSHL